MSDGVWAGAVCWGELFSFGSVADVGISGAWGVVCVRGGWVWMGWVSVRRLCEGGAVGGCLGCAQPCCEGRVRGVWVVCWGVVSGLWVFMVVVYG